MVVNSHRDWEENRFLRSNRNCSVSRHSD
jgi:hypothetical protein